MAEEVNDNRASLENIDIVKLVKVIWREKFLVIGTTFAVTSLALLYALWLPNQYQSQAIIAPKEPEKSQGLASGVAGELGGLASLAGLNLGALGMSSAGLPRSVIIRERLKTLSFFEENLYEFFLPNLMAVQGWDPLTGKLVYNSEIYEVESQSWVRQAKPPLKSKPSAQEAHREYQYHFDLEPDPDTGLLTLRMKHLSPIVARDWLLAVLDALDREIKSKEVSEAENAIAFLENKIVEVNLLTLSTAFAKLLDEQAQTVMLAGISTPYAFEVIESPSVMERKSEPNRFLLLLIGFFAGLFSSLIIVIVKSTRW